MSKYIDADEFVKEMNDRIDAAIKWGVNAIAERNEEIKTRAEQAVATFCEASLTAKKMPAADIEPRWIPVTEMLPEEDKEVLISYRYKEGEGDTSHSEIDITSYGQMYFGGNKVGNNKHWRAPFEYFYSNYEVIAWMPLPEPYKEGEQNE